MRSSFAALLLFSCITSASVSAGEICIAPFQSDPSHGPQMDNTPAPLATSKFLFRIDKRLEATVAQGEMARIENVPHDRKVLVDIRLDGKAFESYWIDLAKKDQNRVCLWLYRGYWHWVDLGWDPKLGCKCGEKLTMAGRPPVAPTTFRQRALPPPVNDGRTLPSPIETSAPAPEKRGG